MGNLIDAIRGRRSIRKYKPDSVDSGVIRDILDLAVWAPSPFNSQPWNFAVFSHHYVLGRQANVGEFLFRQTVPAMEQVFKKQDLSHLIVKKFLGSFGNAPHLIGVLRSARLGAVDAEFQRAACYAVVQNILLVTHDKGLGACWIGVDEASRQEAQAILGITPEMGELLALITIGVPDQGVRQLERKPFETWFF